MKLNLYRRHRPGCEGGKPEDSRSSEHDERRRGWGRKCDCQIHLSGTLDGKFSRKATAHLRLGSKRSGLQRRTQNADSWTGKPTVEPAAPEPARPKPRTTIADAIQVYLSNREAANLAPASLRKYGVFTRKLQAFADKRGYVMLDQFTRADIDVFYSTSSLGIRSKGKMLETLRTFFRFCVNRELVAKSPVSPDLKPPIGANRVANKMPVHRRAAGRHHQGLRQGERRSEKRALGQSLRVRGVDG